MAMCHFSTGSFQDPLGRFRTYGPTRRTRRYPIGSPPSWAPRLRTRIRLRSSWFFWKTAYLYQRLSMSALPAQREAGLAGMLRAGNAAALTSASQMPSEFPENGLLLSAIRQEFRATDAGSVAALGRIAIAPNLSSALRQAATHALAAIHTKAASALSRNTTGRFRSGHADRGDWRNGFVRQRPGGSDAGR
jgi:hypothetical protein